MAALYSASVLGSAHQGVFTNARSGSCTIRKRSDAAAAVVADPAFLGAGLGLRKYSGGRTKALILLRILAVFVAMVLLLWLLLGILGLEDADACCLCIW